MIILYTLEAHKIVKIILFKTTDCEKKERNIICVQSWVYIDTRKKQKTLNRRLRFFFFFNSASGVMITHNNNYRRELCTDNIMDGFGFNCPYLNYT